MMNLKEKINRIPIIDHHVHAVDPFYWEIVATLFYKLMKGVTPAQLKAAGLDAYYANHGKDVYLQNAGGVPFTAAYFAAKGDPVANLVEDMGSRAISQGLVRTPAEPE